MALINNKGYTGSEVLHNQVMLNFKRSITGIAYSTPLALLCTVIANILLPIGIKDIVWRKYVNCGLSSFFNGNDIVGYALKGVVSKASRFEWCAYYSTADAIKHASATMIVYSIIGAIIGYVIGFKAWWKFTHKYGDELLEKRYVDGAQELKASVIMKNISGQCRIPIGHELILPVEGETNAVLIVGNPGQGKGMLTVPAMEHMLSIQNAGQARRVVVTDLKGGDDYVCRFYKDGDHILSPYDSRGTHYTIFNDIRDLTDLDAFAEAIIPAAKGGQDQTWPTSARLLCRGLLHSIYSRETAAGRTPTNAVLHRVLNTMPGKEMREYMGGIPRAAAALSSLQGSPATTNSVILSMRTYTEAVFTPMADRDGPFSFEKWTRGEIGGAVYLSATNKTKAAVAGLYAYLINLVVNQVTSLSNDSDRRIYLLLDEFDSLPASAAAAAITAVSTGRSKGLSTWLVLQSINQLTDKAGADRAKTITDIFGTKIFFKLGEGSAKYASAAVGETEYNQFGRNISFGIGDNRDGESMPDAPHKERLFKDSIFTSNLKQFEFIAQMSGGNNAWCRTRTINPKKEHLAAIIQQGFILRTDIALDQIYAPPQPDGLIAPVPDELGKVEAVAEVVEVPGDLTAEELEAWLTSGKYKLEQKERELASDNEDFNL